jgi:hypothetical protein
MTQRLCFLGSLPLAVEIGILAKAAGAYGSDPEKVHWSVFCVMPPQAAGQFENSVIVPEKPVARHS